MSGELKGLILFGVDPLRDFPDTDAWEEALTAADFVVSFSMLENATTAKADVVFPLETHAEKDGTVTHPDGRLQRVRPSASRPGDIRPELAASSPSSPLALGHDTGIDSQPTAFAALTDAVPFYAGITDADIGGRGIRWQDRAAASDAAGAPARPSGADSPDTQRGAPAAARQPRGISRESRPASSPPAAASALGTYRDLWAGPITELNPPLKFLAPAAARRDLAGRCRAAGPERRRRRSASARTATSVEAAVAIRERVAAGRLLPGRGHRRRATPTPCSTAARSGRDREGRARRASDARSPTRSFVEATWIMVVKSLVIFAVIFGDPADADRASSAS